MKFVKYTCIALLSSVAAGCGSPGAGSTVQVNSVSGTVQLSQVYPADNCYSYYGAVDLKKTYRVSGDTVTVSLNSYSSTNASCTGSSVNLYTYAQKITNDGDSNVTWDTGSAPALSFGSGNLPDPATATKITIDITSVTQAPSNPFSVPTQGSSQQDLLFVDDSGSSLYIYSGSTLGGLDANGYPAELNGSSPSII